jgi:hypothetical protein
MVNVKLTIKELELLINSLGEDFKKYFYNCTLQLNEMDAENVAQKITDVFSDKGIGRKSEPNLLGIELESLIDKFVEIVQEYSDGES